MSDSTTTTTLDQFSAAAAERRKSAAGLYREILLRNDAPRPGDAEKLAEAAAILGRQPENFPEDLATFLDWAECEALAAEQDERYSKLKAATARQKAVAAEFEEKRKALFEQHQTTGKIADRERSVAMAAWQEADGAAKRCSKFESWYRELLKGLPAGTLRRQAQQAKAAEAAQAVKTVSP